MRTSELAATFLLCLAAASPAAAQYKWAVSYTHLTLPTRG